MHLTHTKHLAKLVLRKDYRGRYFALKKLSRLPRFTPTSTNLFGTKIELTDAVSFLHMYREIFEKQIYRFKARTQNPLIIDCGANIGISVLYFKQLYPDSQIIAFEPDNNAFKALKNNIQKFGFSKVELINKAVWSSETTLKFTPDGADGGRMIQPGLNSSSYQIPTVRLRDYLNKQVDFLKMDIEGAETEVLKDCKNSLADVKNLFVEYHSFTNKKQTLPIILQILSNTGFRIHILESASSPQPLYYRKTYLGIDLGLNIFAFREQ